MAHERRRPIPAVADGEGSGYRHLEQEGGTRILFGVNCGRGAHRKESVNGGGIR
jgi:hypothetical protein